MLALDVQQKENIAFLEGKHKYEQDSPVFGPQERSKFFLLPVFPLLYRKEKDEWLKSRCMNWLLASTQLLTLQSLQLIGYFLGYQCMSFHRVDG